MYVFCLFCFVLFVLFCFVCLFVLFIRGLLFIRDATLMVNAAALLNHVSFGRFLAVQTTLITTGPLEEDFLRIFRCPSGKKNS